MTVLGDISLRRLNTLALPGRAEYFCRVASAAELLDALAWARQRGLPVTLLGGGSNIVVAGNVAGLVIQLGIRGIEMVADDGQYVEIKVGAGENWHDLVTLCLARGWCGLENLALIPGSVGAAPVQNIGAYGVEVKQFIIAVDVIALADSTHARIAQADCGFGYRDSIFKAAGQDHYAIVWVYLRLSRRPRLMLDYPLLKQALAEAAEVTPRVVFDTVCRLRRERLPDPAELSNAGSFFKNPVVSADVASRLSARFPDMVVFPQVDGRVKLAAGWLIDRAGWKGTRRGGAAVHTHQALVLVNHGGCDGATLLALAADIQSDIRERFGVALELEPRVVGG